MICGRYQSISKLISTQIFHRTPSRMVMHNPEMYEKYNEFQKRDALEMLQKYSEKINWKPNAAIVDLGCGDGLVTNIVLKQQIPKGFKELVGLDVSEEMVEYAEAKYGDDRTKFFVVDLGKKLPEKLNGRFDHAFSFHALHFIKDQVQVFTNIYDLLTVGGNFFVVMLRKNTYLDTLRKMSSDDKWKKITATTVEQIMPRIFLGENYQEEFKSMMDKIGFKECNMVEIPRSFDHERTRFRGMAESANFFKLDPNSPIFKEFFDDLMERFIKIDNIENLEGNYEKFRVLYSVVIIYGRK